jgi:hypothetical protein
LEGNVTARRHKSGGLSPDVFMWVAVITHYLCIKFAAAARDSHASPGKSRGEPDRASNHDVRSRNPHVSVRDPLDLVHVCSSPSAIACSRRRAFAGRAAGSLSRYAPTGTNNKMALTAANTAAA